jgi:aspartate racemase
MKTIGVLGGLGPQATMDFEVRLHAAAQRLIPQIGNSGHPPLVVYYHRRPPFVMADERLPVFPLQPDPTLLEASHWLGTRADFLVITANGPHIIQSQIEAAAGCKVLSMIDATLAEVGRRGWRTVGLLGFGDPRVPVYAQPMNQFNLATEVITQELQGALNIAVNKVQEGRADADDTRALVATLDFLRARKVDGIILGCTELPFLLPAGIAEPDLINPAEYLAEAAIRFALD